MTDLIERIERAKGPDRGLDAEIMAALTDENGCRPIAVLKAKLATGVKGTHNAPRYTASVDAALTLVPEGWSIGLGDLRGYTPPVWRAHLRDHNNPNASTRYWVEGHATTPTLAIAAAALRARKAGEA